MIRIALDAGHGFNTAGKRTPDDIREWTMNDRVLRGFQTEILRYVGVEVVRTDDPSGKTDVPLTARTNKAKATKCDLLISFHHNAFKSVWGDHGGTETFVYEKRVAQSTPLGNALQVAMVSTLGLRDRGVKPANSHMTREVPFPAALIEVGFMDSNTDRAIRDASKSELVGKNMAIAVANLYKLKLKDTSGDTKPNPSPTPTGKVTINPDAVYKSKSAVYNNKPVPSSYVGIPLEYTLNNNSDWVYFPSLNSYVDKSQVTIGGSVAQNIPSRAVEENGIFTSNVAIYERDNPTIKDRTGLKLMPKGTKVTYDYYLIDGGYVWLHNVSKGKWIPWREHKGEKWGVIK